MEQSRVRRLVEATGAQLLDVAFLITGDAGRARDHLLAVVVRAHHDAEADPAALSAHAVRKTLARRCVRACSDGAAPAREPQETVPADETGRRHVALVTAYRRLPVQQRAVLALAIIEGLPLEQVAHVLDITTTATSTAQEHARTALASACPPDWSRARVEDEVTAVLRSDVEVARSDENLWASAQLAITVSSRRRRRVGMAVAAGGATALLAIGGAVYLAPRSSQARPAATASVTGPPALAATPLDMSQPKNWPLRGSLAGTSDAQLQKLQADIGLTMTDQLVDHFLFAGDVGQSRFVVATTSNGEGPEASDADGQQLAVWSGPRGTAIASLELSLNGFLPPGAAAVVARDQGIDVPSGDLLVMAAPRAATVRYSPEPLYGRDGNVTRRWRSLPLTAGIGIIRSGRLGGMGAVVRLTQDGQPAMVTDASDQSVTRATGMIFGLQTKQTLAATTDALLSRFAARHKVPRNRVTVLDTRQVTMDGPNQDGTGHTPWSVATLMLRTPDDQVFRAAIITTDGGRSVLPLSEDELLPADSWRHRPTIVMQDWPKAGSDELTPIVKIVAPDAAQVRISGPGGAPVTLVRRSPGVFSIPSGPATADHLDLTDLNAPLTLTTLDAAGHAIGHWPAQPPSATSNEDMAGPG